MPHTLELHSIHPVTHNVYQLRFTRPAGFAFQPGQAVDFWLDREGWRENKHPFTMTSLPENDHLEFTIKSYPERHGITEQIAGLKPGDRVVISDAWGAIHDSGPGVFIAGGAGITPFLSILRRRARDRELNGCTLIFSNSRENDIILRDEFEAMTGLRTVFTLTQEDNGKLPHRRVDGKFLDEVAGGFEQRFYICGPSKMVDDVSEALRARGVPKLRITVETA